MNLIIGILANLMYIYGSYYTLWLSILEVDACVVVEELIVS